jgi:hypothetical protein
MAILTANWKRANGGDGTFDKRGRNTQSRIHRWVKLRHGRNGGNFAEISGRAVHFPIPNDKLTHLTPQTFMGYESFWAIHAFRHLGKSIP